MARPQPSRMGPIDIVKKAGMISTAVLVASTEMVIAYSPKSKFAPDFEAAAHHSDEAAKSHMEEHGKK
jgi:hypothetical protein